MPTPRRPSSTNPRHEPAHPSASVDVDQTATDPTYDEDYVTSATLGPREEPLKGYVGDSQHPFRSQQYDLAGVGSWVNAAEHADPSYANYHGYDHSYILHQWVNKMSDDHIPMAERFEKNTYAMASHAEASIAPAREHTASAAVTEYQDFSPQFQRWLYTTFPEKITVAERLEKSKRKHRSR